MTELKHQSLYDSFTEALLEENHEASKKIVTAVIHVNEMFRDAASITRNQQFELDRMDLEMEDVAHTTRSVVNQLEITSERRQKRQCCEQILMVMGVALVVLVVTLIILV